MRWPWSKKEPKPPRKPTREDFFSVMPPKGSVAACPKCGAGSGGAFVAMFHIGVAGLRGADGCCYAAAVIVDGEWFYEEHLSVRCHQCLFRWPERPLDWDAA